MDPVVDPAFADPAFKERVTAAFDGLASRYDTERGGFRQDVPRRVLRRLEIVDGEHAMLLAMMRIRPVPGIDVSATANPSVAAGTR